MWWAPVQVVGHGLRRLGSFFKPAPEASEPADPEVTRKLLVDTKVSALKTQQQLVLIKDSATIDQALKALADNKILSAPVVIAPEDDPTPSAPTWDSKLGSPDILGFVDVRDILSSFLRMCDMEQLKTLNMLQRMRWLEEKGAEFGLKQIKDLEVLGFDGDFLHSTQARASLLELVMYGLLNPKVRGLHAGEEQSHVVHRVALFDNKGIITHIISQTDIIKFLMRNKEKLSGPALQPLASLSLGKKHVQSISPETAAIEAMALMDETHVSSLAVVDANGKIMGNFSASDMRNIKSEHLGMLALPVAEFLALEHKTEYVSLNRVHEAVAAAASKEGSSSPRYVIDRPSRARPHAPGVDVGQSLVFIKPANTLVEAMELLVKHKIHRVYVVDDEEVPVGIVTCTDVLKTIVDGLN